MGLKPNKLMRLLKTFKNILLFPLAVIFSVVSVLSATLCFILAIIPFYMYKKYVTFLSKLFMPGSKILEMQDNALAKGNVYLQRDQYIMMHLDFEGKLDFNEFFRLVDERVIKKIRPGTENKVMFPELKCYIETFIGYSFYRKDKSFDLKNHVKLYKNPKGMNAPIYKEELAEIKQKFLHELFTKKRSPWECHIIHNYIKDDGKEYSVVLNKCHHCLGDGYALLLVFWKSLFLQNMESLNPPRSALKIKLSSKIAVAAAAGFEATKRIFSKAFQFIYDWDTLMDTNKWHSKTKMSERIYCTMKPIPTSIVKEVSHAHGVSVTTVLLSIISGALKRMMSAKGVKTPEKFRTVYSLPLANHPEKLRTHASATQLLLNVGESNEKSRLQLIEEELKKGVRMILLFGIQVGTFFFQCAPFSWNVLQRPSKIGGSTFFVATYPTPALETPELIFLGCRLDAFYSTSEIIVYNLSALINVVKFKDSFFFNFGIQKHLLTDTNEIYDIEKYALEELQHLRGSVLP